MNWLMQKKKKKFCLILFARAAPEPGCAPACSHGVGGVEQRDEWELPGRVDLYDGNRSW